MPLRREAPDKMEPKKKRYPSRKTTLPSDTRDPITPVPFCPVNLLYGEHGYIRSNITRSPRTNL